MDPTAWGWTIRKENLFPIEMSQQPASDFLLEIINCNCKSDCDTKRCGCRNNDLNYSCGCGGCKGINCSNARPIALTDLQDDECTY